MSKLKPIAADLTGQTIVVTGASSGIGASAARTLAGFGAHVIVVGRSPERTRAVAEEVGGDAVVADFSSFADVRRAASEILALAPKIDVLANNAGGSWPKRALTHDGHEQVFQVNHLSPFLLTELLKQAIVAAHGRVINTSSAVNLAGHVNLDDLETEHHRFDFSHVYGATKLENILHAMELAKRWGSDGVTAASFHPGLVATQFGRNDRMGAFFYRVAAPFMKTAAEGADTLVWLATSTPGTDWESGRYYNNRKLGRVNKQVEREPELAGKLWTITETLTQAESRL